MAKLEITPVLGSGSWVFNETPSGSVNGSNTIFDTASTYVAGSIQVYRDGQLMKGGGADYTETDSNTITFTTAPISGSVLLVHYQMSTATFGNADTLDGFHANATPTVGQIPILDSSMAMIGGGMARQAVINGNFDVWQRGTSLTPLADATSYFLADRWYQYAADNGGTLPTLTVSRQILTSGDISNAFYYHRLNTNGAGTSLGADSEHQFVQKIEHGTRLLCGLNKEVTVSFWAKSDIANKKLGIQLWQQYGTTGTPSAAEIINGTNWTLTSTWTKYSYTFTTNTLVGKTFGTDNNDSLTVVFYLMWGSNKAVRVGAGTTAETYVGSGNIDIAQVQLCAGDVALPFQPKSYNQELLDCRRYYQRFSADSAYTYFGNGNCKSTTNAYVIIHHPVKLRTAVAPTRGGNLALEKADGTVQAVTVFASDTPGTDRSSVYLTVAANLVAGNATVLIANNDKTAYIEFSAEL